MVYLLRARCTHTAVRTYYTHAYFHYTRTQAHTHTVRRTHTHTDSHGCARTHVLTLAHNTHTHTNVTTRTRTNICTRVTHVRTHTCHTHTHVRARTTHTHTARVALIGPITACLIFDCACCAQFSAAGADGFVGAMSANDAHRRQGIGLISPTAIYRWSLLFLPSSSSHRCFETLLFVDRSSYI